MAGAVGKTARPRPRRLALRHCRRVHVPCCPSSLGFFVLIVGIFMHPGLASRMLATSAVTPFWEKCDRLSDHFMLAALLTVFRFPTPLLQSAIHDDAVPFAKVLSTVFGLLPEHNDVHKTDF